VTVVDASVVVEMLLWTPAGRAVADRVLTRDASLHAPHLLDIEVLHALRRLHRTGAITASRARDAVSDLVDLPLTRWGHLELVPRVWDLRHNATAYDAAYLALAEALRAPLLTRDRRLAASPGRVRVELI
jgi:predicted nucleic acid-binding protein